MGLVPLLILGLATWRVCSMLVREAGPWKIFQRIRELAGITHDEDGNVLMIPDRFFALLLSCTWCASMWVGTGWLIFFLLSPEIAIKIATAFSLSAVAIMVDVRLGRN